MLDDKGAQLSSPSLPRHGNDAANKDYLQSGGSQALGSRQAWDGPYPGLSSPSCGHLLTLCVFLLPDCRSCLVKPSYSLDSHFLDLFLSHFLYSMSPKCLPSICFSPYPWPLPQFKSLSSLAQTGEPHFHSSWPNPLSTPQSAWP